MHYVMRHSVLETLIKNHTNYRSNYCGLLKRHKKNYDKKKSYDIDEADGWMALGRYNDSKRCNAEDESIKERA